MPEHFIITCKDCCAEWDSDYAPTQCECRHDPEWTIRIEEEEK